MKAPRNAPRPADVAAAASAPTSQELAKYMPLVRKIVAQVKCRLPPNVQHDDLMAAGAFGLLEALRKTADRGGAFDCYARIRIRGAVLDELRAQDWRPRRTRERVERALAEGKPGFSVVALDDLPEAQADSLRDESELCPLEAVAQLQVRRTLEAAIADLPEREGRIFSWHYLDGVDFKDIAERMGVTGARVSQMHKQAMERMRARLAPTSGADSAA